MSFWWHLEYYENIRVINIRVKILSQSFRTCFEVSTYVSEPSERHYNMVLLQLNEGQKQKLLRLVNKCHLSEVQIQDHYLGFLFLQWLQKCLSLWKIAQTPRNEADRETSLESLEYCLEEDEIEWNSASSNVWKGGWTYHYLNIFLFHSLQQIYYTTFYFILQYSQWLYLIQ